MKRYTRSLGAKRLRESPHGEYVLFEDFEASVVAVMRAGIEIRNQDRRADLSAMSQAMCALESDSDLDARRAAFERLQDRFEGVSAGDYDDWESR